ncbi:hypothetical protein [Luteimicrobium subarcticum]|uniref:Uncharacterized protein n=1 Tax=Luteimicrobium subarcticum TaxID=620910 RepID=A0A2M8WW29_9MICO|nr:hypothetical protein [Luteimicrobium subarcticum]PJI95129.1 hypothetical protein CLV34_0983 [Luteimicrobium subarcticum]
MTDIRTLEALGLTDLVTALSTDALAAAVPRPEEWWSVVELVTARMEDEFPGLPTGSRAAAAQAFDSVLDAAVAGGAIDGQERLVRRLNLTLALLRRIPPEPGSALVDPDEAVRTVLDALPMRAEEASDLASRWRTLDVQQIRALRRLKNVLSPGLAIAGLASANEARRRLEAWADVLPALP